MVFGDKGVFKTTDSLYRAIIMSNGIDSYLGKFKVKEGQVLYLSGENQKEDIEITREAIKKSLGVTKNPYIMHREEVGCILDKEYWRELVKFIVKKDIILVIFDTISIFTDDADLTSPVVSNKILSLFKQLSSLGVTVVYLQHTDKQKKNYMGSMRLAANADTVSRITRDSRQRDVYIIDNQWNRAGEHNKLVVRVNHIEDANGELDKIYFELIDDTKKSTNSSGVFNSAQSVSGVSITNEILNLLGKQSMSRKELTQVLSDKTSESTIDRSISILKEAGKVQTGLNKKYELINNSKSEAKDGNLK